MTHQTRVFRCTVSVIPCKLDGRNSLIFVWYVKGIVRAYLLIVSVLPDSRYRSVQFGEAERGTIMEGTQYTVVDRVSNKQYFSPEINNLPLSNDSL